MTDILALPVGLDALRAYADVYIERKELEARVRALSTREAELMPIALAYFENESLQSIDLKGDSPAMLYLRTEHWPSKTEAAKLMSAKEIAAAFGSAGLPEYCEPRVNTQGLRAWLTEQLKQAKDRAKLERRNAAEVDVEQLIPDALKGVIEVRTVNKIGARRRG